jgi:ABC-2 type transport system permease protein
MHKVFYFEILKIFSKWRTYIGFIALAVLIPLIHAATYFEGDKLLEFGTRGLKENFNMTGNLLNAYMVTRVILQSLYIQIPFLITLVGGDLLAGEATSGTYRLLLIRPISRFEVVLGKYLAGLFYVATLIGTFAVLSLGLGILIFGTGDMLVVTSQITIITSDDAFWRLIHSFGFSFLSMAVVYTISFMFSALVENSIGPIVSTMAIIIVMTMISLVGTGFLSEISPYLFTTYMNGWSEFFNNPIDWAEVSKAVYVLVGHLIVIAGFTFIYFIRKDILT